MPLTDDDISERRCEQVFHCKMCVEECPTDVAPMDYVRESFGAFRKKGEAGIYFQLWCERHDCNITTIHVAGENWWHDDRLPLRVLNT